MSAKILLFDIESTPFIGYTWGKWQQNVIDFVEEWHLLCFAYKWIGEDGVHVVSQPQFHRSYARNRRDDRQVAQAIWKLLDEADIVVAHNGDKFDIKKVNARFAVHGLGRPSPFHTIDTKKIASKHFSFGSNSLNDLGHFLNLGEKLHHTGFDLWAGCMAGDERSWRMMEAYNKQDVRLLEKLYFKFRNEGWITNHPNVAILGEDEHVCPTCGAPESALMKRGTKKTRTLTYQQWHCQQCKSYSRSRLALPRRVPRV